MKVMNRKSDQPQVYNFYALVNQHHPPPRSQYMKKLVKSLDPHVLFNAVFEQKNWTRSHQYEMVTLLTQFLEHYDLATLH